MIYTKLRRHFRNVDKTQLEFILKSVAVDVPNFGGFISSATIVLVLIIANQRQHQHLMGAMLGKAKPFHVGGAM